MTLFGRDVQQGGHFEVLAAQVTIDPELHRSWSIRVHLRPNISRTRPFPKFGLPHDGADRRRFLCAQGSVARKSLKNVP